MSDTNRTEAAGKVVGDFQAIGDAARQTGNKPGRRAQTPSIRHVTWRKKRNLVPPQRWAQLVSRPVPWLRRERPA